VNVIGTVKKEKYLDYTSKARKKVVALYDYFFCRDDASDNE